jgi:hypothetical protein
MTSLQSEGVPDATVAEIAGLVVEHFAHIPVLA